MSLFQRKPDTSSIKPLYTLGNNKTFLIIGLGNIGDEYNHTRHNIGFEVVDEFAKLNNFPGWINKKDLKCELAMANMGENRVILCKPATLMNNSGDAAQLVQHFYKIYNPSTLAIYDELAVNFGQIRSRVGGSDAGHNGVKSLINQLGDDFSRLRIGIGSAVSEKAEAADFVLGKFSKEEQGKLDSIIKEACAVTNEFIFSGSLPHETRSVL